jgi:rhomboid protease GluP
VSALFLHFGVLHLIMNMVALRALAPFVEQRLGKARMLAVYLFAGLVGSTWIGLAPVKQVEFFLGASGCIMGIIGATAAILVYAKRHRRAEVASQRLQRIGLVLLLQVGFDLTVPGISMIAHWSGVAAGFLLGYLLVPDAEAERALSVSEDSAIK